MFSGTFKRKVQGESSKGKFKKTKIHAKENSKWKFKRKVSEENARKKV